MVQKELLNGYIIVEELEDMDNYITEPSIGSSSGILGALALGINEIKV